MNKVKIFKGSISKIEKQIEDFLLSGANPISVSITAGYSEYGNTEPFVTFLIYKV